MGPYRWGAAFGCQGGSAGGKGHWLLQKRIDGCLGILEQMRFEGVYGLPTLLGSQLLCNVGARLVWRTLLIRSLGKIIQYPHFVLGGRFQSEVLGPIGFFVDVENYEGLLKLN